MLTTIFRTTTTRLAPTLRKSVLTATTATTVPSLAAGFSLFNLGSIASFGSMGRNDIANDEAPMDPKVVKPDTEWRAQLSPEQVGSRRWLAHVLFRSSLVRSLPFSSESSGKKEPKLPEQGNTTSTRMTVFTVSTHTSSRHLSTFLLDADYVHSI